MRDRLNIGSQSERNLYLNWMEIINGLQPPFYVVNAINYCFSFKIPRNHNSHRMNSINFSAKVLSASRATSNVFPISSLECYHHNIFTLKSLLPGAYHAIVIC